MDRPPPQDRLKDAVQEFTAPPADAPSRRDGNLETYGEGIDAVNQVTVVDNGEPLVDLRAMHPPLGFAQAHPWGAPYRRQFYARERVAWMLVAAQQLLPAGLRLLIIEGYRPVLLQRRLFHILYQYLQCLYPAWDEGQLREAANVLIADPDINAPPPHATGGAVDLTLADETGKPLDMTSPLGWNEGSAPTACTGVCAEARANRQLLVDVLTAAGLTNYPGEWWHWSYGEPGWALRTAHPEAFYGPLASPFAVPGARP